MHYETKRLAAIERWKDVNFKKAMSAAAKLAWKRKSCKIKHSKAMKNNWKNKSYAKNMSDKIKEIWKNPSYADVIKSKVSKAMQGYWNDLEKSADMRETISSNMQKVMLKRWKDKKYAKYYSSMMQKKWENSEYAMKVMQSLHGSPNNFEKIITQIINLNQLPWKFVGNGKFILAGKNPDFVHTKEKIVAEAYCDYWKSQKGMTPEKYIITRKNIFAREGYQTIFIHYHDNPDTILEKLIEMS
jgi:hypothetical protein